MNRIDFILEEDIKQHVGACLKVIGVGGAGGNAVNSMVKNNTMESIEFILANTDAQALALSPVKHKIQIGAKVTKGLGAGSNPDVGRRSAEEDIEEIAQHIKNTDILFLTGGLGGGTGTGGLPVIAQVAREMGVLSVAIVTKPFTFEGKRRMNHAEEAIKYLRTVVDTLIIVPNQKLLELVDPKISMLDAFALSNSILYQAIKGISDIITQPGHINVDFADVRSVMKDMGMAIMGTGRAEGEGRARQAALRAISSQLLENVSINGARGVLINITGNIDLGLHEINEAASVVYDLVSEDANIILGSVIDSNIGNEIMVTVIATGFEGDVIGKQVQKKEARALHYDDQALLSDAVTLQQTKARPFFNDRVPRGAHYTHEEPEAVAQEFNVERKKQSVEMFDAHDLDTPTFLRKNIHLKKDLTREDISKI